MEVKSLYYDYIISGSEFTLVRRLENRVFTLRFTRTISRCVVISAIKFMDPEKREFF